MVPSTVNIVADASAAIASMRQVQGMAGYAYVGVNPPTIIMNFLDTFLPVLKVPNSPPSSRPRSFLSNGFEFFSAASYNNAHRASDITSRRVLALQHLTRAKVNRGTLAMGSRRVRGPVVFDNTTIFTGTGNYAMTNEAVSSRCQEGVRTLQLLLLFRPFRLA